MWVDVADESGRLAWVSAGTWVRSRVGLLSARRSEARTRLSSSRARRTHKCTLSLACRISSAPTPYIRCADRAPHFSQRSVCRRRSIRGRATVLADCTFPRLMEHATIGTFGIGGMAHFSRRCRAIRARSTRSLGRPTTLKSLLQLQMTTPSASGASPQICTEPLRKVRPTEPESS